MQHVIVVGRHRGTDMRVIGPFPERASAVAWASDQEAKGLLKADWQAEPLQAPSRPTR